MKVRLGQPRRRARRRWRRRVNFPVSLSLRTSTPDRSSSVTKTTKLYDRTADAVSLDEIERIVI